MAAPQISRKGSSYDYLGTRWMGHILLEILIENKENQPPYIIKGNERTVRLTYRIFMKVIGHFYGSPNRNKKISSHS